MSVGIILLNIYRGEMTYQGWGQGGKGKDRVKAQKQALTQKTKNAVDHCQNNKNIKAVSACHCTAISVVCNCCLNCCVEQSQR